MRIIALVCVLAFAALAKPAGPLTGSVRPATMSAVGPVSGPETDPEILAIRARQEQALACGDRAELKRLEGEVQAILLERQVPQPEPDVRVGYLKPEPVAFGFNGPDAVLDTGRFISTGADYTMDGTMFATATRKSDTTVWFYRSEDHGLTWDILAGYYFNTGRRMFAPRISLVAGEGDSAFLYLFLVLESPARSLYVLRTNMDGTGGSLITVASMSDSVTDFAACRDYTGDNYWLYAVAVNDLRVGARNAVYMRSADYGRGWVLTDSGSCDLHPHYSFGAGSWLYHALEGPDDIAPGELWLFYNPAFGTPGMWQGSTVQYDTFSVRDPVIAPAFTLPESTSVVWSLYAHNYMNSGDWDVHAVWSTDGGRQWPYYTMVACAFDTLEHYPDLRNYTSLGNGYINGSYIKEGPVERTVYRRYASSSNPGGWSDPVAINEHQVGTGRAIRPLLVYSPGCPGTGGGCIFVGAGLQNLYFNAPWLTALHEAEERHSGRARSATLVRGVLNLQAHGRQHPAYRARLLDVSGRTVLVLKPGANDVRGVAPGVYFVHAEAEAGRTETVRKVVIDS
jgi:hypothetical protein